MLNTLHVHVYLTTITASIYNGCRNHCKFLHLLQYYMYNVQCIYMYAPDLHWQCSQASESGRVFGNGLGKVIVHVATEVVGVLPPRLWAQRHMRCITGHVHHWCITGTSLVMHVNNNQLTDSSPQHSPTAGNSHTHTWCPDVSRCINKQECIPSLFMSS